MKKVILFILIVFQSLISYSQLENAKRFAKTITQKDLEKHLYTYASDEFEGRNTGSEGQKKAVEYLKNFYIENDIKPGDPDKDYFQKMTLNISRGNEGEVDSENVIAIIEGTEKPEEYLILTAHLDHVGYGRTGSRLRKSYIGEVKDRIHNGADDDGSGTVAMLEIAQAFKQASKKGKGPKRSIIFLHVTGEEKGLLGSAYYSDNPIYPLSNTVANLNLDMIGRIDPTRKGDKREYIYIIGSDHDSQDLHEISEQTNLQTVNLDLDYRYNAKDDPQRFYYRSDHYNFAKKGIPIIFYFSGTHEDYHLPSDTPDKINYDLLELRSKLIFYTAWNIANRDQRVVIDPKPEPEIFEISSDKLETYEGKYSAEGVPLVIDIYVRNEKLFIEVMNQSLELTPVSEDKFKIEAASLELKFNTENGTMQFKQGPYQIKLSKQ
ncbi:MAG: M20/M25/M40 family metallo-hydrolase [Flavobacteriaceae bacterium]|nr:M20/M25/M40 family metallo-hydrolase [Flavobacteriaceae bacterium]MBL6684151.1 M20/M25/M40 family metallo-hydrolase [Flavobacteriaceae bacterium]